MRNIYFKLILLLISGFLISQDQSPFLDIANELLVRKKLADKLPDVFDDTKFLEVVNKIDETGGIESKTHGNRLLSSDPEFQWCLAQTYLIAGRLTESVDHYREYKILTMDGFGNIHDLFKRPINELKIEVEKRQADLANKIYASIQRFKYSEDT